jgi:hypothetical protein
MDNNGASLSEVRHNVKEKWAVFVCGNRCIIGRLLQFEEGDRAELSNGELADAVEATPVLRLGSAIDLFSPLRPVQVQGADGKPAMAFARDPVVTALDFTVHPVTVNMRSYDFFYVIDEMHEDDKKTYLGFIKNVQEMSQRSRAAKLDIVLPGNGPLPQPPQRRG